MFVDIKIDNRLPEERVETIIDLSHAFDKRGLGSVVLLIYPINSSIDITAIYQRQNQPGKSQKISASQSFVFLNYY